jgi:hypothetical protein
MSIRGAIVVCRASKRKVFLSTFLRMTFSTPTGVNAQNPSMSAMAIFQQSTALIGAASVLCAYAFGAAGVSVWLAAFLKRLAIQKQLQIKKPLQPKASTIPHHGMPFAPPDRKFRVPRTRPTT